MKKPPDCIALVFTTDFGTTVLNADGSSYFISDPQEAEQWWQALGVGREEWLPVVDKEARKAR